MKGRRIVVIGGDATGMSAASRAKRRDPSLQVKAFEMGRHVSYGACGIPYAVGGIIPELDRLVVLTAEEFQKERGIEVLLRHRVERINPTSRNVTVLDLATGRRFVEPYDHLVLSTGAQPMVPDGVDLGLTGVFVVRNLEDAQAIKDYLAERRPAQGLIIGAGYIGLEMAEGLAAAGVKVSLAVRGGRVMSAAEEEVSAALAAELARQGVTLLTGLQPVDMVRAGAGQIKVIWANGQSLVTDLVIVGVGVLPRSQLAKEAGLKLGARGAVAVDLRQATSDPAIFSGGDCAEAYHLLLKRNVYLPLALGANRQGRIIGDNLSGGNSEFPGVLGTAVTKVFDLTAGRTGLGFREAQAEGFDPLKVVSTANSRAGYYPGGGPVTTVLVVDRPTRRLLGVHMVGRDGVAQRLDTWVTALTGGMTLEQVAGLDLAYAPPFSPVWGPVLIAAQVALKKLGGDD